MPLTNRSETEAVRDSERSYRLLVEGVTDYAIYMLDPGDHITSWNRGAQRIKQYAAADILGCEIMLVGSLSGSAPKAATAALSEVDKAK